ncbi:MAG: alpha-glucosidase C-terminal domain-containing protein [Anaerolineae bacterium]|nr:alpha-glucosidase C-terminal domain-containing protein [Anaerolineae bacterium]
MRRLFTVMLVVVFALLGLNLVSAQGEDAPSMFWWNDRVFYQIFVRSFQDSDGDGNGDIQGLISRLDYLNDGDPTTDTDLGVTGLWLMPMFQSPSYHGYHVIDYMQVEADYGTNEDFAQLVEEAHKRGIAIIVDLVINHTSREHPWFRDAQTPGSTYDQWYRWSVTKPAQIGPWGQQVWYGLGDRYYYAVFWDGMPDLNLRNPAVTQAIQEVGRFWLEDMGVDGFRMDAVRYMVEDGNVLSSSEGNFTWLTRWNEFINSVNPDALTVGEIWTTSFEVAPYVPSTVDLAFEFDVARFTVEAVTNGTASTIIPVQERALRLFPQGQYASFLTNHDQNRILNEVSQDVNKARVAASMLLTGSGVPFIYYGEEIGMIGAKPDECIRTPMQWDAEARTAPFMAGKNCKTNEATANVEEELQDEGSLLNHYRRLIHLRNANPLLQTGAFTVVESASEHVYSFLRHDEDEAVLVVINLSDEATADYGLSIAESVLRGTPAVSLLYGEGELAAPTLDDAGGFAGYSPLGSLAPYSTTVIALAAGG